MYVDIMHKHVVKKTGPETWDIMYSENSMNINNLLSYFYSKLNKGRRKKNVIFADMYI